MSCSNSSFDHRTRSIIPLKRYVGIILLLSYSVGGGGSGIQDVARGYGIVKMDMDGHEDDYRNEDCEGKRRRVEGSMLTTSMTGSHIAAFQRRTCAAKISDG